MPNPSDGQPSTKGTLAEVAAEYLRIPRKCSDDTAEGNVSRLRSVVSTATGGAGLETVRVSALPDLWHRFVATKQGREAPNYSLRERQNVAINSALRQAASVFRPGLHVHYRKAGIALPPDAGTIEMLPIMATRPDVADDAGLLTAWSALGVGSDLWLAVGLARFAGLRQGEILACRGKWIVRRGPGAVVELEDRDDDHWRSKTGRRYAPLILNPTLAEYLLSMPPESLVINRTDAARWLGREPQNWLRPFTGSAGKPLHRCRGLYADHVRRETEEAILARSAGIKAASHALGHVSEDTTLAHYLTLPDGKL